MNRRVSKTALIILIAGGAMLVSSCKFFNTGDENEHQGEPLARVYSSYLYKEDVQDLIPTGISDSDSLAFLQNYINIWAKNQLMIFKAEYNLTESKKNFEKQIREYRNDLLKFAYRQEYIQQNLDTAIADSVIKYNYANGTNDFLLKEHIVRVDYVVINQDAPKLEDAIKWFYSDREKDREKLRDYVLKYAYKFSLQDSNWVGFDQLRKIIPIPADDPENFIKSTEVMQFKDPVNVYLLRIREYKQKGDKAPLAYSKDIIKNVLLNKRKLKLLNDLEQNLLNDALEKQEFEVY